MQQQQANFGAAWRHYRDCIDGLREQVLACGWMDRPGAVNAANYLFLQVQAAAFNMIIGPKRDYPTLSLQTTYQPGLYTLSNPSADFNYRFGFLDGARSYRIKGRRNGALFVDIQINNTIWGGDHPRKLGNYDLDTFALEEDGSFELLVSAEPQPGNWLRLDSTSPDNLVLIREVFDDWARQRAEFTIERIDDGRAPRTSLDDDELTRRLGLAEKFIKFYVWDWGAELTTRILTDVGVNRFHHGIFETDQGAGNNPHAIYPGAIFEIGDDDALLIEAEIPESRYWNVQLCDSLWQVCDFTHHQSSLNSSQACIDEDGRFRAIIAKSDPGAANWLDPVNQGFGIVLFRFYGIARRVKPEVTYKGPIAGALARLPAATKMLTEGERAKSLAARANAIRVRFLD